MSNALCSGEIRQGQWLRRSLVKVPTHPPLHYKWGRTWRIWPLKRGSSNFVKSFEKSALSHIVHCFMKMLICLSLYPCVVSLLWSQTLTTKWKSTTKIMLFTDNDGFVKKSPMLFMWVFLHSIKILSWKKISKKFHPCLKIKLIHTWCCNKLSTFKESRGSMYGHIQNYIQEPLHLEITFIQLQIWALSYVLVVDFN